MKQIPLTQGKFALVDDEDYDFLMLWKWYYSKATKGRNTGYARTSVKGEGDKKIRMHRLIIPIESKQQVDHVDGDGLNNQKTNLRCANNSQNTMNRAVRKESKTQLKGVYFESNTKRTKKWRARIRSSGIIKFLGYFLTAEEAHEAYKKAAIELHGEFAKW